MHIQTWLVAACSLLLAQSSFAQQKPSQPPPSQHPLLLIGASFAEGKTPYHGADAPLGGVAVGFGNYLSLGQALTRHRKLPGYVINEAQAGAGTFAHPFCAPGAATCGPAGWDSYQTQLDRALSRVAMPPTFSQHTASYVVVTTANDCLHADAAGVPQSESQPCTLNDMNASVDRLVAVGKFALAKGLTPIFDIPPQYDNLDLPKFQAAFGLAWVIGESDYKQLRTLSSTRLKAELPGAIVLDIWKDYTHIGDGIHPDVASAEKAADVIARHLRTLDR
ncbi:SGNH/GDSL hydrolase family protein [Massilia sp. CCM 8733]|uniref:SGNH/GDSL hydrolase family protein n=1 Tax=Massilia mucilaginosa TaxID=2609282 RepID=A0ABX0NQ86_9BURK|nr:SGNH/GDSL hydrolase family protein [Massilia mucilaginosa]NHZ89043.1 SGNH/GDSL hydrolase family protein [Massilia mucilaginosa]